MDPLLIVLLVIVGIPALIFLGVVAGAVFIYVIRILSDLAPMIGGIALGAIIGKSGHTNLGAAIIVASIVLGFLWLWFLEEHYWKYRL